MHALTHTRSPRLVAELPWATPRWQAIFEMALSGASSSQLHKKRAEEEEKEKYQPGIYWSPSPSLSHLLKAGPARCKLAKPPFSLVSLLFLIKQSPGSSGCRCVDIMSSFHFLLIGSPICCENKRVALPHVFTYTEHNAVYVLPSFDRRPVCECFAANYLVGLASSWGVLVPPRGLLCKIQLSVSGFKKRESTAFESKPSFSF